MLFNVPCSALILPSKRYRIITSTIRIQTVLLNKGVGQAKWLFEDKTIAIQSYIPLTTPSCRRKRRRATIARVQQMVASHSTRISTRSSTQHIPTSLFSIRTLDTVVPMSAKVLEQSKIDFVRAQHQKMPTGAISRKVHPKSIGLRFRAMKEI